MNEEGRCNSGTRPSWQGHDPTFSLTALPQPGTSHPFPICRANFTHLQDSAAVTSLRLLSRKVKCEKLGVAPTHAVRGAASVTPTALGVCEQGPRLVCVLLSAAPGAKCRHDWRRLRVPGTPRSPTERSDCVTTDVLRKERSQGDYCVHKCSLPWNEWYRSTMWPCHNSLSSVSEYLCSVSSVLYFSSTQTRLLWAFLYIPWGSSKVYVYGRVPLHLISAFQNICI